MQNSTIFDLRLKSKWKSGEKKIDIGKRKLVKNFFWISEEKNSFFIIIKIINVKQWIRLKMRERKSMFEKKFLRENLTRENSLNLNLKSTRKTAEFNEIRSQNDVK